MVRASQAEDDSRWLRGDLVVGAVELFKPSEEAERLGIKARPGRWGRDVIDLMSWSTGEPRWMLEACRRTAEAFPLESRGYGLRWEHYKVAALSEEPHYWVKRALSEGLSVSQLKRTMEEAAALTDAKTGYTCKVCCSPVGQKEGIFCRSGGVLSIFCSRKCLVDYFVKQLDQQVQ